MSRREAPEVTKSQVYVGLLMEDQGVWLSWGQGNHPGRGGKQPGGQASSGVQSRAPGPPWALTWQNTAAKKTSTMPGKHVTRSLQHLSPEAAPSRGAGPRRGQPGRAQEGLEDEGAHDTGRRERPGRHLLRGETRGQNWGQTGRHAGYQKLWEAQELVHMGKWDLSRARLPMDPIPSPKP